MIFPDLNLKKLTIKLTNLLAVFTTKVFFFNYVFELNVIHRIIYLGLLFPTWST